MGRHWHFLADFAWLLTGLVYIVMLFASPEWRRLISVSWQIVRDAGRALLSYLTLHIVEAPGRYNALQQLTYAAVVFLLAPLSIATGIAMSPAIAARSPWYIKIFHGRQSARSLHFLALCAFILFFIGHVALVVLHGFRRGLAVIVLGETQDPHLTRALAVWLSGLAGIVIIHVVTTMCSHRRPRFVQRATQAITDPLRTLLFGHEVSAQHYTRAGHLALFLGQRPRAGGGDLPGDGARSLRQLQPGGGRTRRTAAAPDAGRPPRHAQTNAGHQALLHPGLVRRRRMGRRVSKSHRRTLLPASGGPLHCLPRV
jgi:sulfoxide reductase catalytic subunit YedY